MNSSKYLFLSAVLIAGCSNLDSTKRPEAAPSEKSTDGIPPYAFIRNLAASATSADSATSLSFNVPIPTLTGTETDLHLAGDAEFGRSHSNETGLGPAFNATSCVACHARDGRGALPMIPPGQSKIRLGANESLLLRISLEKEGEQPRPVAGYAPQLYHRGLYALRPDSPGTGQADIEMSFTTSTFLYPDGRKVELRKPVFTILNAYDSKDGRSSALQDPDLKISPRIGAPMIGLGLLEAIDAKDILELADPNDSNGDGISGRVNVINGELGRFGWKANTTTLRQQVAAALSNDMGIRSSIFKDENISGTALFTALIERLGVEWQPLAVEFDDDALNALEFYSATLAIPARRDIENPTILAGAKHFNSIACTSCHTPRFETSRDEHKVPISSLRGLTIFPFSDGLLHDMGTELADDRSDHQANGREWKTRPLWGIGLTQTVNPRAGFLHDGRARTLEEAILYHGGEAAASRRRFTELNAKERDELISFLRSL